MAATRTVRSEAGFTLIELMIAALITTVIMGVAFSTFDNALQLNDSVLNQADSSQNLRAGINILVRDLMQAGRNLPIGGISIPSGDGASAIHRPSPPTKAYFFENITATSLSSIVTGFEKGPMVDGRVTDIITILMDDPFLGPLTVNPSTTNGAVAKMTATGDAFSVGDDTTWLQGNVDEEIAAIKAGDLIYFLNATGSAIQAVTKVDGSNVYFEPNDPFNFNQRGATLAGSITQILGAAMTVRRVYMYSYWVAEEAGVPRLMRALNMYPATALAGIVEDLDLNYDLVDGVVNPVNVPSLPYTLLENTFSASQIRKVNVHVGVRSETKSKNSNDYLRNHVSTVVSVRNLAYVDRYK